MTQREFMKALYLQQGGDMARVIAAYAQAEADGTIRRRQNKGGTSAEAYAAALWADGVRHGWLGIASVTQSYPELSRLVQEAGRKWRDDPLRPKVRDRAIFEHWSQLLQEWREDDSMPLLVRKGRHRGVRHRHGESGREIISCDNSPAHWSFMGALAGALPDRQEILRQLTAGRLPLEMASTRATAAYALAQGLELYRGCLVQSEYGSVSLMHDGRRFKLCHLDPVGLKSRGEASALPMEQLKSHFDRFMNPLNMIVVPIEFGGIGECADFLEAFREPQAKGSV